MLKLSEVDKRLIDGVISSIDWDQIVKFYKILNKKIGYEQVKIKGIVRNDKVTPETTKEELSRVLEYVIDNDLPEMSYGPWLVIWTNGEWEIVESIQESLEDNMNEIQIPIVESKLQVHFIPQSVTMKEDIEMTEDFYETDDTIVLEERLKSCIEEEDYVLAGKIRDVLEELKKRRK